MISEFGIRTYLRDKLKRDNTADSLVIEELGLCQGDARIDVAVINGHLHGYEIKSEADTLRRLDGQTRVYSSVLDTVTLVTVIGHSDAAIGRVPEWWGIWVVELSEGSPVVEVVRTAEQNPKVDKYALAQLLWREEALWCLVQLARCRVKKTAPRAELWKLLAEVASESEINQMVRAALKARRSWRPSR